MIDYIIGIGVTILVVALVIRNIMRKKAGVSGGCGSSSWSSCSGCGCGCESDGCKSPVESNQQPPQAD